MAAVHEIYQMLAPALGQIPNYIGKETPDEYIQKITNVFQLANNVITVANNANAGTFVDADKCDILKSKMGDKFSTQILRSNGWKCRISFTVTDTRKI